ncbi:recombinase family protein [Parasutterella secunda]|uniref:recombinase family protein n=1 Tax=Parasutterella secunda TaxID=626947 RepID=UPI0020122FB8|nr:recombinase family protein [Parasutterella secunda]MCL1597003.1 recombinase family protein [Parasutterella secunda]
MSSYAKIAYARVSTDDQNLDRQLETLKAYCPDKIFTDHLSGKNLERPGFQQMMDYVREGDIIYVASMDRMARNLDDLLATTKRLQSKGITVHFLKENICLNPGAETSSMSKLIMSIMGAVAEFERSLIRERQREGILLAKARGVYKGRKPIDPDKMQEARKLIDEGFTKTKVCEKLNISRQTLYKYLKQSA